MTWIRIEDTMPSNPKIASLSDRAFRLYVTGLCYAGKHLTDGFIPAPLRRTLGTEMASKLASKLLDKGLWIKVEGGYQIHDYLKHQTSKAQAEIEKENNRLRAERARKAKSSAIRHGVTNGERSVRVTLTDTPTPTDSDIKNSLSDLKIELKEAFELCELLAQLIVRNGGKNPTISKTWIQDMNRIITLDSRKIAEVKYLIEWSQKDTFWCSNILSPKSLRAKFDQLRLKSPLSGNSHPKVEVKGTHSQSSNQFGVSEATPVPPVFTNEDAPAKRPMPSNIRGIALGGRSA